MKRYFSFAVPLGLIIAVFAVTTPSRASAFSIYQPFGGRVVTTFVPGVICRGEGPIAIVPSGFSLPGPYIIQLAQTKRYSHFTIHPGSWIVGLYDPVPSYSSCYTTSLPPAPVPVFPIVMFGSSL